MQQADGGYHFQQHKAMLKQERAFLNENGNEKDYAPSGQVGTQTRSLRQRALSSCTTSTNSLNSAGLVR